MSCFEKSKTLNSMTLFFLYIYIFFFLSDFIDHIKSRKSGEEGGGGGGGGGLWTRVGEEILKGQELTQ